MADMFGEDLNPLPALQGGLQDVTTALGDPRLNAALLSTGLSLMTPSWGGPMAAFAQGLGAAGEGIRQGEKLDIAKQEAESKQALRESQATAAEARAGAAGARLSAAGDRLQYLKAGQENLDRQRDISNLLRVYNSFDVYQRRIAAENKAIQDQNVLRGKNAQLPLKPAMTREEFINSNPEFKYIASKVRNRAGYTDDSGGGGGTGGVAASGYPSWSRGDPEPQVGDVRDVGGRAAEYAGNGQWKIR